MPGTGEATGERGVIMYLLTFQTNVNSWVYKSSNLFCFGCYAQRGGGDSDGQRYMHNILSRTSIFAIGNFPKSPMAIP